MVKIVKSFYYLTALNARYTREVNIIESNQSEDGIILSSDNNPETNCIRRDLFEGLSKETKQVIEFLIDAPEDLLNVLRCNKTSAFSVKKFKRLVASSWGRKKSRKIFWELKNLMKSLR